MRPFLICSMIIFCLGCQKEVILPKEYDQFIGTWENKMTDEHVSITFKKGGIFILEKSFERGEKFQITEFRQSSGNNNGERYTFFYKNKTKNGLDYNVVQINSTNDTILFDYGILTYNEEVITVQRMARVL